MAIPIHAATPATLDATLRDIGGIAVRFVAATAFRADPGRWLLVPAADGSLAAVVLGVGEGSKRERSAAGRLAAALPPGDYRLVDGFPEPFLAALSFRNGAYRFDRSSRAAGAAPPRLRVPDGVDAARLTLVAEAIAMGRDLVNRPASDLGPDALEAAIVALAERRGAAVTTIRGATLAREFPLVHAVGRAAAEAPRLVDLTWGDPAHPAVTLVGKGVCFDTGGLDLKPAAAMLLMKKDMGGAATALALADMIMAASLRLRLRVIVPAVENAVAAASFRPGDILRSRKGLTVEIGNTDAEGRLILADALTLAEEDQPSLLLDFATLTGAARVALGPELPAMFTDDETLAADVLRHAQAVDDPCWRLPLWDGYDAALKGKVADLTNAPSGTFAGAITAALFLRRFVGEGRSWAHFDIYGWNPSTRPGHPEGGEVQTAHALFDMLERRFGARDA